MDFNHRRPAVARAGTLSLSYLIIVLADAVRFELTEPGVSRLACFQGRCNRPLYHTSRYFVGREGFEPPTVPM